MHLRIILCRTLWHTVPGRHTSTCDAQQVQVLVHTDRPLRVQVLVPSSTRGTRMYIELREDEWTSLKCHYGYVPMCHVRPRLVRWLLVHQATSDKPSVSAFVMDLEVPLGVVLNIELLQYMEVPNKNRWIAEAVACAISGTRRGRIFQVLFTSMKPKHHFATWNDTNSY